MQNTTSETTPRKSVTSQTQQANSPSEIQELIRTRAYQLFEQRGRKEGHAEEDWLAAESEILHARADTAAA